MEVGDFNRSTELGKGSCGKVFLGIRKLTEEKVALKRIVRDEPFEANAEKEIESLQKLSHPNIVRLLGFTTELDFIWIITEFCDLGDLEKYLLHHEPTAKQKLRIMHDCASGLEYIHKNNIVHRDLKLNNILLRREGAEIISKITDFGVAKIVQGPINLSNVKLKTKIGPLSFWAPELWASEQDHYSFKVDNFALGLVFLVVMEYSPQKHSHLKSLYPEDFVFKDSPERRTFQYGQILNMAVQHGEAIPVLFELKANEEFPRAELKLIITRLTTLDPKKRMPISEVVHDLACLLGRSIGSTDHTRQHAQTLKLNEDVQRLTISIEEQNTEMRRLKEENAKLQKELREGKEETEELKQEPIRHEHNQRHPEKEMEFVEKENTGHQNQSRKDHEMIAHPKLLSAKGKKLIRTQPSGSQPQTSVDTNLIKHIPEYKDSLEKVNKQLQNIQNCDEQSKRVIYNFGVVFLDLVCGLQNIYLARNELAERFDNIPPSVLSEMNAKLADIIDVLKQLQQVQSRMGKDVSEFFSVRYYSLRKLLVEIKQSRTIYMGFFCSYLKPHKLAELKENPKVPKEPTVAPKDGGVQKEIKRLAKQCEEYEARIAKLENEKLVLQKKCHLEDVENKRLVGRLKVCDSRIKRLEYERKMTPRSMTTLSRSQTLYSPRKLEARMSLSYYAKQKSLQRDALQLPDIKESNV